MTHDRPAFHEANVTYALPLPTSVMANCINETIVERVNASEMSRTEIINDIIKNFAMPGVCAFGIVGNILNLTILTRRKLQKSFRTLEQSANLCLIALALSDLMFCLLALLTTFLPPDSVYGEHGVLLFYGLYSYFFINVFIMESTMLTVAMSLERYLAICFPLRQDLYLTTRRIKYVIVFTFIFSLLFNIPVLWRFEAKSICSNVFLDDVNFNNSNINHSAAFQALTESLREAVVGNNFSATESNSYHAPQMTISSASSSASSLLSSSLSSSYSPSISPIAPPFTPSSFSSSSFSSSGEHIDSLGSNLETSISTVADIWASSSGHDFTTFTRTLISMYNNKNNNKNTSLEDASITPHNIFPPSPSPLPTSTYYSSTQRLPSTRYIIRETPGKHTENLAYRIAWAIVGNVIPLILLFFFNVCLCRQIYLSFKMRRQFKRQSRAKSSSHILTLTLVVIVVMFFILVAPSEFLLLLSKTSGSIEPVLNFMQSLNFSVNFILYCIISPTFRKTLKYIFLCGCYNIYQVSRDWKKEFETSLM